jgi:hypothetical protein
VNFDLLLKLVKLANHNNTEGEANAAARKVCKMLSENNYQWLEGVVRSNGGNQQQYKGASYDPFEDLFRHVYNRTGRGPRNTGDWTNPPNYETAEQQRARESRQEQARRDQEAREREQRDRDQRSRTYWSGFDWGESREERQAREARERAEWKKQEERRTNSYYTWTGGERGNKGFKKEYKETVRNCTQCGMSKMTTDEATPYVCAACKWENYRKSREQQDSTP